MLTFKEYLLTENSIVPSNLKNHLKKKGYDFLGSGIDQAAFLEPNKKTVLKIFGTGYGTMGHKSDAVNFSIEHEMFATFANYCKKNATNPYLPKIYGWEPFIYEKYTYIQYRTELLKSVTKSLTYACALVLQFISDWIQRSHKSKKEIIGMIKSQDKNEWDYLDGGDYRDGLAILSIHLGEGIDLFLGTIYDLAKLGKSKGYFLDLHGGNFMINSKGDIVIVDPWVVESYRTANQNKVWALK